MMFKPGDKVERFLPSHALNGDDYGVVGGIYTFVKYDIRKEHIYVEELKFSSERLRGCSATAFRLATKDYDPTQQPYDADDI